MDDYAKKQAVESEAQRLAAKAAAEQKSFPLNMDAALYRTADNMGLGEVKTDEMRFTLDGGTYITQGFVDGILYVKDGEWTNIHKIAWPATPAAATSSATSMGAGGASATGSSASSAASSSTPKVGTPIGMSASGSGSSGGLQSSSTGAAASAPAKPAATPPAAPHPEGGLGGILGDVVSKVEDAMGRRHPETKE